MNNKESGFTLIELAIVIGISASVVATAGIMLKPTIVSARIETTKLKEKNISETLANFANIYGRLPCPADPNLTGNLFGTPRNSGPNGNTYTTPTCGAATASNYIGILPFKALGLGEEQAKDAYGNFFTYAVNPGMTKYDKINPDGNKIQAACASQAWLNPKGKPLNYEKANVCCPLVDTTGLGTIRIIDALGSANDLFNQGPVNPKPNYDPAANGTQPVEVKIIAPITQRYRTGAFRESQSCNENTASWPNQGFDSDQTCRHYSTNYSDPMFSSSWKANAVMTGRYHPKSSSGGDEDGDTYHEYGTLKAVRMDNGVEVPGTFTLEDVRSETMYLEWRQTNRVGDTTATPTPYWNPANANLFPNRLGSVMVGRQHKGDAERHGYTLNRTGFIKFKADAATDTVPVTMYDRYTTYPVLENKQTAWTTTPDDQVIVDRIHFNSDNHQGDEKDGTDYVFAKMKTTVNLPVMPEPPSSFDRMVAFVLVSHGDNGDNAFYPGGRKQVTAPANAQESENENNDLTFLNRQRSTTESANYFDDIVLYKTNDQLVNMAGNNSCSVPK